MTLYALKGAEKYTKTVSKSHFKYMTAITTLESNFFLLILTFATYLSKFWQPNWNF